MGKPVRNFGKEEKIKSKGSLMNQVVLFFVVGASCLFIAVYIYGRSEDTAYHRVLEQYNKLVGEYEDLKNSNETLNKNNLELTNKISSLTSLIEAQSVKMNEVVQDCESAQTHCANIRESLIKLQDQVSKRRPVMKIEGPIQLEVISNKNASPKSPHSKSERIKPKGNSLGRGLESLIKKQDRLNEDSRFNSGK